jgi:hypothetical protein
MARRRVRRRRVPHAVKFTSWDSLSDDAPEAVPLSRSRIPLAALNAGCCISGGTLMLTPFLGCDPAVPVGSLRRRHRTRATPLDRAWPIPRCRRKWR